jgi:nucleoside-diphosphate-sugar epimerase
VNDSALHVVFGTGQVGRHLVDRLLARGLKVRTVRRSAEPARHPRHEPVQTDVYDRDAAIRAAAGAAVVYHCASTPYPAWRTHLPRLFRNIAAATQAARARLIVLDNLYALGATGTFDEDTLERPCSQKGRIRKALADELRMMHTRGDLAVTLGRASDFFGPGVTDSSLLHPRAIDQLLHGGPVDVVSNIDLPHSWSYTPDVAEGLLQLGLHPELDGQTLHLPVLPPRSGRVMLTALAAELGTPLRIRRMPSTVFRALGWINPVMRELAEMQYQFENPFVMSDARIRNLLPVRPTPFDAQIHATARALAETRRTR